MMIKSAVCTHICAYSIHTHTHWSVISIQFNCITMETDHCFKIQTFDHTISSHCFILRKKTSTLN